MVCISPQARILKPQYLRVPQVKNHRLKRIVSTHVQLTPTQEIRTGELEEASMNLGRKVHTSLCWAKREIVPNLILYFLML